jgi:predicted MPP superfamily phosphohydrolase
MPNPRLLHTTSHGWHWVASTWAKLIALTGLGGAGLAYLTYLYASRVEPRWLDFNTRRLCLRRLSPAFEGYRIVQLTDFHLGQGKLLTPDRLEAIVRRVNAGRPDVVLVTGDFSSHLDEVGLDGISRLRLLKAPDGVFGILGNHDYWAAPTRICSAAQDAGIQMLLNRHVVIRRGGAALVIAGLDDVWEKRQDIDAALRGIPAGAPVIMMVHESNYAEWVAQDSRVDVQLSGHSHGGQVRVPLLGPLALPNQAWKYPMGLYRLNGMWLYVSRGVGLAQMPLRFNCRPEITTFILEAERPT